ncbi:uncharacterized protein LOC131630222 [Vicia villosa]|uniref:uncharacterized protein LOC131630222 n=1 Tax=Vicia villosa TaxID=3911 RepID=UPI00273C74B0|nr:uncharacterized protein LOC131630222 [Vicia villosa]
MTLCKIIFHHGGEFVRENFVFYRGGDVSTLHGQDPDTWSFYEAMNVVLQLGFDGGRIRMWRKIEGIDENFFHLTDDLHVTEITKHCIQHNVEGHIWLEHFVGDNTKWAEKPNIVDVGEVTEDDDSPGVRFGDSEEERVNDDNEGFVTVEVERPNDGNRVEVAGKKLRYKLRANKDASTLRSPKKIKLRVPSRVIRDKPSSSKAVEHDVDYESEELGSSDPDVSDNEKMPKYEKFRGELLNKDYEFKLGMEFNSLVEFKDAIREWSVLNGREIRFVKNESTRVRVECRGKYGFTALCSKVGDKHTFQLKTWVGTHTCSRVLNNKSANSKWVSKVVVEKRHQSGKVKVSDLMAELRSKYLVGISKGRAWRAKHMAEKIIEGDCSKQYSMLYNYAAELKKQNDGNTVKISVERPVPTLPPRFGSFYFCFDGCKKGFLHGCRPFIGVDGCHLKTQYGGQLLIAVARDPNDQYFPLAFGVVETETKESWRWFLQLLMEDIGQQRRYVFISDQQKV